MASGFGTGCSLQTLIASGQKLSGVIDLDNFHFVGLIVPAMTSATLGVLVSASASGTFVVLNDETGTPLSITIPGGGNCALGLKADLAYRLGAFRYIKFQGASNEAADRTLSIVLKA